MQNEFRRFQKQFNIERLLFHIVINLFPISTEPLGFLIFKTNLASGIRLNLCSNYPFYYPKQQGIFATNNPSLNNLLSL